MLSRRTPMKRTGFSRKLPPMAVAERPPRAMPTLDPSRFRLPQPVSGDVVAMPKEAAQESEPYRRLVAAMPCVHCGIQGYSQHAHLNLGKGLALKTDDRTGFPLCCTRPDEEGCHVRFDQYRLFPGGADAHHEAGKAWGAQTRAQIRESGQWPKRLPIWAD